MTTPAPPDDAMSRLARSAAVEIAFTSKASEIRELVRLVQHDERAAIKFGRIVAGGLLESLGRGEP